MSARFAATPERRNDSGLASPAERTSSKPLSIDEQEAVDALCLMSVNNSFTGEDAALQLLRMHQLPVEPAAATTLGPWSITPGPTFTDTQGEVILRSIKFPRPPMHQNLETMWNAGVLTAEDAQKLVEFEVTAEEMPEVLERQKREREREAAKGSTAKVQIPVILNRDKKRIPRRQKLAAPLKAVQSDAQRLTDLGRATIPAADRQHGRTESHLKSAGLPLDRGGDETSTLLEHEEIPFLARQSQVRSNLEILTHYRLVLPSKGQGLLPCDPNGNRLQSGSVVEKAAIFAVRVIIFGDEVLVKEWITDIPHGEEAGKEDPLVWVRTDSTHWKSSSIALAIIRLSKFDPTKQTMGIWRDPGTTKKASPKHKAKTTQSKTTEKKPSPEMDVPTGVMGRSTRIMRSTTISQMQRVDGDRNEKATEMAQPEVDTATQPEASRAATRNSSRISSPTTPQLIEDEASHGDVLDPMDISEPAEDKPKAPKLATRRSSRIAITATTQSIEAGDDQSNTADLMDISEATPDKPKTPRRTLKNKGPPLAIRKTSRTNPTPKSRRVDNGANYVDAIDPMDISEPLDDTPTLIMRFTKGADGTWSVRRKM